VAEHDAGFLAHVALQVLPAHARSFHHSASEPS
jgi:hypothetical protein